MRGGYTIPGYFEDCQIKNNEVREKRSSKTLYYYKNKELKSSGFFGKTVLVFKNGGIYQPGLLGKKLFNVTKYGEVKNTGFLGKTIGALLRGITRENIERGQVLAKPKSVSPHTEFEGQVYILSKEEGGRHTAFFSNYRPQFYFRTTDVTGVVTLPEGTEMVMPGDNTVMNVELIHAIAIEEGTKFSIREGGRTVGAGTVTKILK